MSANRSLDAAAFGYDEQHALAVAPLAPSAEDHVRVMRLARRLLPLPDDPRHLSAALELMGNIVFRLAEARPGVPLQSLLLAAEGLTLLAVAELAADPGQRLQ
jgi:hypothetical protein